MHISSVVHASDRRGFRECYWLTDLPLGRDTMVGPDRDLQGPTTGRASAQKRDCVRCIDALADVPGMYSKVKVVKVNKSRNGISRRPGLAMADPHSIGNVVSVALLSRIAEGTFKI